MELLTIWAALIRRKWLVIQSIAFFTTVGLILALVLPKNYEASSRVLVSTSDSTMSILADLGLSEMVTGMTSSTDDITNKIALTTTRPIINQVIYKLQLRDSDGRPYEYEEVLVAGLTGELEARPNISVEQSQGTELLVFEARAGDAELARLMADTAVQEAIREAQEASRVETKSARMFIDDQLKGVEAEFDKALSDIADASAQEQVVDLETEMKAAVSRLSEQMLAMEENAAEIQETRAQMAERKGFQKREGREGAMISPNTANSNGKIRQLQDKLVDLKTQREDLLTDKTEKHPDIKRIDSNIATIQTELDNALDEQHALDPSVDELQTQLSGLISKGREIEVQIKNETDSFGTYPEKMRKMTQLTMAADAAESVYKSLKEQGFEIAVAEAMTMSDLKTVEPAVAPDKQSSPKVLVNLIIGFVLGSMFGFGLVFLVEYVDDSIKGPDDLKDLWPLPRLGMIPRFQLKEGRRVIDELGITDPVAEAYRTVRNSLVFASLDKPLRLIGASSCVPGEGKTTFLTNLAISFAREGKKTLLVDCDLRRPAQHRSFASTSNHVGLTDVVTGSKNLNECIQPTPVENLWMLSSGPTPSDPARMVESLRLRQVLLDLSKSYDIVLVDLPPVLVVNDAMVIARAIDGLVIVIESMKTSRKLFQDLRNRFESAAMEPVGVVLNKMNFTASGYAHYLKAYRAYHASTAQSEADRKSGTPQKSTGSIG